MDKPKFWLLVGLVFTLPLWFVAHGAGASPAMVIRSVPREVDNSEVHLPALREILRQGETAVVTTRILRTYPTTFNK